MRGPEIGSVPNPVKLTARRLFAFNQHRRDLWVEAEARALRDGAKVLDVGAGTCRYRHLFEHCEYRAQDACRLDQDTYRAYGAIDLISDICEIPVEDASHDVILCTEVLEHVPEPIKAIEEFARILKLGGQLFVTAPLGSGLHQLPFHYYGGYTPVWYEHFLTRYGFCEIQISPNGGFFEHFGQESQRFAALLSPRASATKILFLPLRMVAVPVFGYLTPVLCAALAPVDRGREFTVGYHVKATKSAVLAG